MPPITNYNRAEGVGPIIIYMSYAFVSGFDVMTVYPSVCPNGRL